MPNPKYHKYLVPLSFNSCSIRRQHAMIAYKKNVNVLNEDAYKIADNPIISLEPAAKINNINIKYLRFLLSIQLQIV